MLPPDKDDEPGTEPTPRDPGSTQTPAPDRRARRGRKPRVAPPAAGEVPADPPVAPPVEPPEPAAMRTEAEPDPWAEPYLASPPAAASLGAPLWPWTEAEPPPTAAEAAPEERITGPLWAAPEPAREAPKQSEPAAPANAPAERIAGPRRAAPEPPREAPRQSEPVAPASLAPAPPPPARSRGGFWSGLVGGLCGAALGAGAAWYLLEQRPDEPDPALSAAAAAIDRQEGEIATQSQRLAAMQGDIESLASALGNDELGSAVEAVRVDAERRFNDLSDSLAAVGTRVEATESRLGEIDEQVAGLGTQLDAGAARLGELEARPIADPETANQVLRAEIADMRQEVEQATEAARAHVETMRGELAAAAESTQAEIAEAQRRAEELEAQAKARAEAAAAEAETAARSAEARAALARVAAALDSGETFGAALPALGAGVEVPAALAAAADRGVPTLATLRETYPDAARAALTASRAAATEGAPAGRVVAFLRTQTQARSLTPQEGSDPDAVLSRAEAALGRGDVAATLAELEALPEAGRAAMQGWIDEARIRADAVAAAETLSRQMN